MRSEPVLSSASPCDGILYPVRSLRRKPMTRISSMWLAIRRLPKSWVRVVYVAHPYIITFTTSALGSLTVSWATTGCSVDCTVGNCIFWLAPKRRPFDFNLGVEARALADSTTKALYTNSVVCLYLWPTASIHSAFDAVLGSEHRCMASVFIWSNT